MGSNDHMNVPDPVDSETDSINVQRNPTPSECVNPFPPHKRGTTPGRSVQPAISISEVTTEFEAALTRHAQRLDRLESQMEIVLDRLRGNAVGRERLQGQVKDLARSIKRLAQGHSIGNLGLPTDESWDPPV